MRSFPALLASLGLLLLLPVIVGQAGGPPTSRAPEPAAAAVEASPERAAAAVEVSPEAGLRLDLAQPSFASETLSTGASPPAPRQVAPSSLRSGSIVDEAGQPIARAWVSDGDELTQTDELGRFSLPAGGRAWSVVAPGYRPAWADPGNIEIVLEPFLARAIYLAYRHLWNSDVFEWALSLAREGTINAIVVDIKEEGGGTLPLALTLQGLRLGALVDPGEDVGAFLRELGEMGIYRIARQVTFLDARLARGQEETALRLANGAALDDGVFAWTDPRVPEARAYNIAVAAAAAPYFDEIQFDYVRYPGNPSLAFSGVLDAETRRASIATFADEAAAVLHRRGVAVGFALFGITATDAGEAGIGQSLEDLASRVDYLSPMVYPSAWPFGSFGVEYPAAEPARIVGLSVALSVGRARRAGDAIVRPWLQDFQDYGLARLPYGPDEVAAQIEASREAGGLGFMLWDPSLHYALSTLRQANRRGISSSNGVFPPENGPFPG